MLTNQAQIMLRILVPLVLLVVYSSASGNSSGILRRHRHHDPHWEARDPDTLQLCLFLHNVIRSHFHVDPLKYDSRIHSVAQHYADSLARQAASAYAVDHDEQAALDQIKPSGGVMGEYLYFKASPFGYSSKDIMQEAVEGWYKRVLRSAGKKRTNQFTVMVWRDILFMGFGIAKFTQDDMNYYVCVANYAKKDTLHLLSADYLRNLGLPESQSGKGSNVNNTDMDVVWTFFGLR